MKHWENNRFYRITVFALIVMLLTGAFYLIRILTHTGEKQNTAYDVTKEHENDTGSSDIAPAPEPESPVEADAASVSESGSDPDFEAVSESGSDPDFEAVSDGETEQDSKPEQDSESDQNSSLKTESETETEAEAATSYSIDPDKPMVALTFDDGPGRGTTAILDLLEQYDVRATFFVLGLCLEQQAQAEKLQRAYDMGCAIGSHTYDHISFKKLSAEEIREQLARTNQMLTELIGSPATLIRPPYGHVTDAAREAADAPFIHWSIDTEDWRSRDAQSVIEEVQEKVQDGDIILMHDIYPSTAEACETLIPWLLEQGYQLVTVPELMDAKGVELENGMSYNSGK